MTALPRDGNRRRPARKGGPKAALDPRKLMERAIEVMRKSVAEPRADGKASPSVGVVLWKPDGTVETACRGELRDGDHAEYTLLERKNRDSKLDGAMLFATLEPCAPGSRRHPKLGCAERIVLARIREVWIGIEDPDPTVDRKGIKYLQDNGVTVQMFDRDLQEAIKDANKTFIAQALERAAAARAERKPKRVTLSPFEGPIAIADTNDLSTEALGQYKSIAKIDDIVGSPGFNRRLVQQGLLKQEDGRLTPTGFGLLLFGREPRAALPQAGLLGTIHFREGNEEPRDFDGPQVLVPGQALQWLRDKLPNPIDRSGARRREAHESLFELAREGIVNALVHRDYGIEGAKCQLIVTEDTIVVKSPGGPVPPITLEQMQSFNAPMLSRNPVLHYVFAKMELAEERGLGLKSMRNDAQQARLPLPKYSWEEPYLVLTIYRSGAAAVGALETETLGSLSRAERSGWAWLATRDTVTSNEYAEGLRVPNRTALNHLKHFTELGLVRKQGSGPATRYEVIKA
ncbi:MAG TPA: ATP-binding protein [Vicinamibacterales bacterium]|nr:ATP-binding protein [Vicinamibacterales bacterium]